MSSKVTQSSSPTSGVAGAAHDGGAQDHRAQGAGAGSAQDKLGNQAVQAGLLGAAAARTTCDLDSRNWYADLQMRLLRRKDLPVDELGKGVPVVEYFPLFAQAGPGMQIILRAHEEVHVANARPFCEAFKKDIDDAASGSFLGLGDKEVSSEDYILASNRNHRGTPPSCEDDEKSAYAETTRVAEQVLADPRFADEHELIRKNLEGVFRPEAEQPTTCGPASAVK